MNNPYVISIGCSIIVFIIQVLMKRAKSEPIDKLELLKMSSVVAVLVLGSLHIYESPIEPVLSEPFISSSEF